MNYTLKDFGYAPGRYANKCTICEEVFYGDKRAIICKDCANKLLLKQYNKACDKIKTAIYLAEYIIENKDNIIEIPKVILKAAKELVNE